MVLSFYCQAQPKPQLNWAELALVSLCTINFLIRSRNQPGKVYIGVILSPIWMKFGAWVSNTFSIHISKKGTKTKPNLDFFGPKIALICLDFSGIIILLPSSAKAPTQLGWVSFSITLHNKFLDPQPESTRNSLNWSHFKPYLDEIWVLGVKLL